MKASSEEKSGVNAGEKRVIGIDSGLEVLGDFVDLFFFHSSVSFFLCLLFFVY